mmetsp:Transcript_130223/g.290720  ORF Transcript_130223/g.290720 Transcript_130223/m.290720 type:complete len:276 (+) Transcript_130223:379-1206(+)
MSRWKLAMPPGGRRGQEETKSRKRARSAWSISTSTCTRWPKSGALLERPPTGWRWVSSAASSHSTLSSPQRSRRSSEGRKALKHSTGSVSFNPARKASTWAETPTSNQNLAACSTNAPAFSAVTGRSSPPAQSGAPPSPVSRKQAPMLDMYSSKERDWEVDPLLRSCPKKRSAKSGRSACARRQAAEPGAAASPITPLSPTSSPPTTEPARSRSAEKSARRPQSSPAMPLLGRGKAAGPKRSPRTREKNSSASGSGTMKPSRNAWPMRRPRKRNL